MDIRRWLIDDIETQRFQFALTSGAVPPERWSERPRPGDNSVAWLVWHIARWQDISLNVTIRDAAQVYDDTWSDRLGMEPDPGTGFTDAEVDELSARIDPVALDAYRNAVQDATVAWLDSVDDAELHHILTTPIDTDARWDRHPGLLNERAAWIREFGRGADGARTLRWTVVGHGYWHLGELQTVTSALGYPTG